MLHSNLVMGACWAAELLIVIWFVADSGVGPSKHVGFLGSGQGYRATNSNT